MSALGFYDCCSGYPNCMHSIKTNDYIFIEYLFSDIMKEIKECNEILNRIKSRMREKP